mmetsp:Transcript_153176/g.389147  ORF Transcript_153176/g.389147 Transcript_153176/m.389147 type:complete len:340 (+) Transcript_153176:357-1376(+)
MPPPRGVVAADPVIPLSSGLGGGSPMLKPAAKLLVVQPPSRHAEAIGSSSVKQSLSRRSPSGRLPPRGCRGPLAESGGWLRAESSCNLSPPLPVLEPRSCSRPAAPKLLAVVPNSDRAPLLEALGCCLAAELAPVASAWTSEESSGPRGVGSGLGELGGLGTISLLPDAGHCGATRGRRERASLAGLCAASCEATIKRRRSIGFKAAPSPPFNCGNVAMPEAPPPQFVGGLGGAEPTGAAELGGLAGAAGGTGANGKAGFGVGGEAATAAEASVVDTRVPRPDPEADDREAGARAGAAEAAAEMATVLLNARWIMEAALCSRRATVCSPISRTNLANTM